MIYVVQASVGGPVKIGYTSGETVDARVAALQAACPFPLLVLRKLRGDPTDEYYLHRQFAAQRLHGEWFDPVGPLLDWLQADLVEIVDERPPSAPSFVGPLPRRYGLVLDALVGVGDWATSSQVSVATGLHPSQGGMTLRALHSKYGRVWRRQAVVNGRPVFEWRSNGCLMGGLDFAA